MLQKHGTNDTSKARILISVEVGGWKQWWSAQGFCNYLKLSFKENVCGCCGTLHGSEVTNLFSSRVQSATLTEFEATPNGLKTKALAWLIHHRRAARRPAQGINTWVTVAPQVRKNALSVIDCGCCSTLVNARYSNVFLSGVRSFLVDSTIFWWIVPCFRRKIPYWTYCSEFLTKNLTKNGTIHQKMKKKQTFFNFCREIIRKRVRCNFPAIKII